jgi:hypothetical protein
VGLMVLVRTTFSQEACHLTAARTRLDGACELVPVVIGGMKHFLLLAVGSLSVTQLMQWWSVNVSESANRKAHSGSAIR